MILRYSKALKHKIKKLTKRFRVSVNKSLGKSDYKRWNNRSNLLDGWDERTTILASYIKPNTTILEFGAGRLILEKHLPKGCTYHNSDIVKRNASTLVIDLNKEMPELPKVDVIVFSGVLEYVKDVEYVLRHCMKFSQKILFSYSIKETYGAINDRRLAGWINDYTTKDIIGLSIKLKVNCRELKTWNKQKIFEFYQ
jgi:2-polyprenyl-3-methyl-5-hydroxy-6-metoxy-1,4-benzoquinol methylase